MGSIVQRSNETRTTRTPVFWDTPTATWLPILVMHIRSQVKTKQSYKFLKIAKNSNFEILQATLLLKLLDNMYKYEMDPTRTVGATERMRDRRTDGWTDGRSETNIPPKQLHCVGGIITKVHHNAIRPDVFWDNLNTVQCHYNTLQHCKILHK